MSAPSPAFYDDGQVVVYHADCLAFAPELPKCDLALLDPPFFMPTQHYNSRARWQKSWGDTSVLSSWWESVVAGLVPRLRETGWLLTFCDDESYPVFYPPLYRRFDNLASLIWDKGAMGMGTTWRHGHELIIAARWEASKWRGGASLTDVLRYRTVPPTERLHPVDKPTALLQHLIECTTDPGDLVVDAFLGGGSTLVAAKNLGRRAIGIEIEQRYCEIAVNRLRQDVLLVGS